MRNHPTNMSLAADMVLRHHGIDRTEVDKELATETLLGHVQNLQDRLGLRDPQMAEVLQDLADWFSTEVTFTTNEAQV